MLEFLHGHVCKIVFEDLVDPITKEGYYWEGRTTVSSITSEKMYTKIKLDSNAYPFPMPRDCTNDSAIDPDGDAGGYPEETPIIWSGGCYASDHPAARFGLISEWITAGSKRSV